MLMGFIINNIIIFLSLNILMIQTLKKISGFTKLKKCYSQLSFWKKIIIIFTFNTFILLILSDSIMLILFAQISNDIVAIANSEKDQFISISNKQITQCNANRFLNRMGLFSNLLTQLTSIYTFYSANPEYYSSPQTNNTQIPPPTSSYLNISYDSVGYYDYNNNSTYTDLPYLDEIVVNMLTIPYFIDSIKRINIFISNNSNSEDLTARTIPASNNFTIPNTSQIYNRFRNIAQGRFNISTPYDDTLTKGQFKQSLVSLRSIVKDVNQTLMFEIEVFHSTFVQEQRNIYYFPQTIVLLTQKNDNGYIFFSNPPTADIANKMDQFYAIGNHRVKVNELDYVSASIGLSNNYPLGSMSQITNRPQDPFRSLLIVKAGYIQKPSIEIKKFLNNENNILILIVLAWSFVIILSTIGLSIVVGSYIFHNLKMLYSKMDQYIKDPKKFHLIVIQLKELELSGILRKVSDNLIGIIEKIQVRKRQRKDRINPIYLPLNLGEPKFQERQQLNDYNIIKQLKEQVRMKIQEMQRQELRRQTFENQKTENQKNASQRQKKQ